MASTIVGSSPSSPMTIAFLRKMLGLRSRITFWRGRGFGGCAAHFVHDFHEGTHDLVPEHQEDANHPGNTGGHGHHLIGASVEREYGELHRPILREQPLS